MKNTAVDICRKLQNAGFQAFFAGGAVRDRLLGEHPEDIDIATNARPEQIEAIFSKSFPIGRHFGVILIEENGHHFEVATFRSDSGNSDGRRPDAVFFTDEKSDAFRRDFTINALFWDPISEKILDFVGGISDLENRIVRFVGNPETRIDEDFLRILRAIRFKNRLHFSFDRETENALHTKRKEVFRIAPERIREEMTKMLLHETRAESLRETLELGILKVLLPELARLETISDSDERKTVFEHTMRAISFLKNPNAELAWATLFHDLGKYETAVKKSDRWHFPDHEHVSEHIVRSICRRLAFSRFSTEKICWLVKNHIRIYIVPKMARSHKMHFFDEIFFEDLLALAYADSLGSDGSDDFVAEIEREFHEAHEQKLLPQFHPELLSGSEIQTILDIPPSRKIGELKTQLRHLQIEGEITNADMATRWLLENEKKNPREDSSSE